MATTVYSYDRFTDNVQKQIDKYGGTIYLNQNLDCAVNGATGVDTCNTITTEVKGILTNFSDILVNNTDVLESDRQLLIGSSEGRPVIGNTVDVDDTTYRVIEIKDINPGVDQPIAYKLHLRSFALAEDLNALIVTLQSLPIGSIVVDPKAVKDHPKWFVLAHGYNGDNITTLIEHRVFHTHLYDVGVPDLNRWVNSDLYVYLQTTYLSQLSVELTNLLQSVPIQTGGFTSPTLDKISLLSKEELTGIEAAEGSSGSQIDYFDSDIKRVALDQTDLDNTRYWTRDYDASSKAWVVNLEGELDSLATENVYGVRPIIFLQGANEVELISTGEYELQF